MGKGKSKAQDDASRDHIARPLSSLKDPSSFAPPPKHINYHGGAAMPDRLTPDTRGLGKPLTAAEIRQQEAQEMEARQQEEVEQAPPPQPWRTDTTGLRTDHLPPPPGRADGIDGRAPPPPLPKKKAPPPLPAKKAGPSLPPRLPPRQNSNPDAYTPEPPPTYTAATAEPAAHKGYLNQGSLSRLGAAGVSIPGFGIGSKATPPTPSRTSPTGSSAIPPPSNGSQLSELSSRFSQMNTSSPTSSPKSPPTQGTSFAEKQAAIRTAQSFKKDPSSVSLSDARTAASTANNFRERHGEQVASGVKTGNEMNQKYGIGNKIGGFASKAGYPIPGTAVQEQNSVGKKVAPPPPAKKDIGARSAVIDLSPSNFDRVVMQSGTPAFVEFYAPYCKYCKEIIPAWEELAQNFKDQNITIAKVDADREKALGQRFGVSSYPTLLYFDGYNEEPEKYQFQRTLERFTKYVTDKTGMSGTPVTTAGTGTPPPIPLASKPPVPLASKPGRFGVS